MAFLDRLLQYKASPNRFPQEDFLTEILAEMLRLATRERYLHMILKEVFRLPSEKHITLNNPASVEWTTQHVIGHGHTGTGKRPDLVGTGDDFFLIIENKINAGYTGYWDESGYNSQLDIYAAYQKSRRESLGGLILLTHYTAPPDGWKHPVVRWTEVYNWSKNLLAKSNHLPETAFKYAIRLLTEFLEDQNMTGTRIDLSDIIAMPAYDRLLESCKKLGRIGTNIMNGLPNQQKLGVLSRPHGGGSGDFSEPKYFGEVMTPNGGKVNDSDVVLWCGVLSKPAYRVIKPNVEGIPELSVGIAFWANDNEPDENAGDEVINILGRLRSKTPNMNWKGEIIPSPDNPDIHVVGYIQTSLSFIELHQQAGDDFWDEPAKNFFETAFGGLAALPTADIKRFLSHFKAPKTRKRGEA